MRSRSVLGNASPTASTTSPRPEVKRIGQRAKRSIPLEGMRCAAKGCGANAPPIGGNTLDQHSLADSGLTLDQEGSGRSAPHGVDQLSANGQLGLSANQVISRR